MNRHKKFKPKYTNNSELITFPSFKIKPFLVIPSQNTHLCIQVRFVTNKEYNCVGVREVTCICQPGAEVVVCGPPGDVIHHEGAGCTPVVGPVIRNGMECEGDDPRESLKILEFSILWEREKRLDICDV